ncbi:MAG: TetR/AcrR family transcriptional regulator [Actinomycetota bacterium]
MTGAMSVERVDGRTARRQRGRLAVIEAAFRLLGSGEPATTEMLASEAGISTSSLFRYFEGLDDLYRQLAEHFHVQHAELFDASPSPGSDRTDRIAEFVELRLRLAAVVAPWGRRVDAYALTHPEVAPVTMDLRQRTARQVDRFFAPELDRAGSDRRAELAAAIDATTSASVIRTMRDVHERSPQQIARSWTSTLALLLAVHDDRPSSPPE